MKTVLEREDIQAIAREIAAMVKPVLVNNNTKDNDVIFTKKTLAKYLSVSVKWVDGYKELGLPFIPVTNGIVRFRKSDIDKWLESMKVPAVNRIDKLIKDIKREQP